MKKVLFTRRSETPHWVGDGFPVRNLFNYNEIPKELSPFLLLDYAGPADFPANPSSPRRGVDQHPHRGFETVTLVYDGEVEHRDSAGGGGVIEKGDVQWMTAGSGLVHEERHGKNFSKSGGRFEMIQLWVNLPKKDKMTKPRYQGIKKGSIPTLSLLNDAGIIRVIAGQYQEKTGPAQTMSPLNMWDLRLNAGAEVNFEIAPGDTALVFVLNGHAKVSGSHILSDAELAVLDTEGDSVKISASEDTKILFLSGTPFHEPVVGYGPFVMNSQAEILQAMQDYEAGKMGSFTRSM